MTTLEIRTRPVCDRCGTLNDTDGSICIRCHGSVSYSHFPKTVRVTR